MNHTMVSSVVGVICVGISVAYSIYVAYRSKRRIKHCMSEQRQEKPLQNVPENLGKPICVVCSQELGSAHSVIILPCTHRFHRGCVTDIFKAEARNSRFCPLCVKPVNEDFIRQNFREIL